MYGVRPISPLTSSARFRASVANPRRMSRPVAFGAETAHGGGDQVLEVADILCGEVLAGPQQRRELGEQVGLRRRWLVAREEPLGWHPEPVHERGERVDVWPVPVGK